MKIVIAISDATYDYWTRSEARAEYVLADAIRNGIVLPKEADELIIQDNVLKNPTFWKLLQSLKQMKATNLNFDDLYIQQKYSALDSAIEKLEAAEEAQRRFIDILEELRSEIWGYDIPSPTVPEYVEHHNQMQALLKLIDVKIKEVTI